MHLHYAHVSCVMVSCFISDVSCVMCHSSCVTRHLSCVMCATSNQVPPVQKLAGIIETRVSPLL